MQRIKEKKERALGVKLSIKAGRCNSPKCALVRRPFRPGPHGKSFVRAGSEFKTQLQEKQKIRFSYGLTDHHLELIFKKASGKSGNLVMEVIQLLESRLDNVVYRLGLAESRSIARQLINHGHIMVNGRKVSIPSYIVKPNDKIVIRAESKDHPYFKNLADRLKGYVAAGWLSINPETFAGQMTAKPFDVEIPFDINAVVDYYSR